MSAEMDPVRLYGPGVRMGNWVEEEILEQDALKDFLQRKDRGHLTVQKIGDLRSSLLQPVSLSASPDGLLRFGDTVMLVHSREMTRDPCDPRDPCILSIIVDISSIASHPGINSKSCLRTPCEVGGASDVQPCVRNTFIITSVDGTADGEILKYEQNFTLRTTAGFGAELYLASDFRTFHKYAKKSRLQEVSLVEQKDFLCCWRLLYFDPQERPEHEGFPVQVNTKLLLCHAKTNQCLAALPDHTLWSVFGNESETAAHTFLDSHKAEQQQNHWMFMTSDPRDEEPRRNRAHCNTSSSPESAARTTHQNQEHRYTHTQSSGTFAAES